MRRRFGYTRLALEPPAPKHQPHDPSPSNTKVAILRYCDVTCAALPLTPVYCLFCHHPVYIAECDNRLAAFLAWCGRCQSILRVLQPEVQSRNIWSWLLIISPICFVAKIEVRRGAAVVCFWRACRAGVDRGGWGLHRRYLLPHYVQYLILIVLLASHCF